MPHSKATTKRNGPRQKRGKKPTIKAEARYTVGLAPSLAHQVERYAQTVDTSMSKAIATLVRLGLEGQESRKREFFKKLKANIESDDPSHQDQLVDEFRSLILGH